MKRLFLFLICCVFLISLCGCSGEDMVVQGMGYDDAKIGWGLKKVENVVDGFGVEASDGETLTQFFVQNDVYIDEVLYKAEWILNGTEATINFYSAESSSRPPKTFKITQDTFSSEMRLGLKFVSLAL